MYFFATLAANLVSLSLVAAAAWLATHDKDGWGWFLFGALVMASDIKAKLYPSPKK